MFLALASPRLRRALFPCSLAVCGQVLLGVFPLACPTCLNYFPNQVWCLHASSTPASCCGPTLPLYGNCPPHLAEHSKHLIPALTRNFPPCKTFQHTSFPPGKAITEWHLSICNLSIRLSVYPSIYAYIDIYILGECGLLSVPQAEKHY